jgi:hypothetical protein
VRLRAKPESTRLRSCKVARVPLPHPHFCGKSTLVCTLVEIAPSGYEADLIAMQSALRGRVDATPLRVPLRLQGEGRLFAAARRLKTHCRLASPNAAL